MGTVTFNTTIDKTVDIEKNVTLDVFKTVTSTVELTGSLATAEASADALGGGGGAGGGGGDQFLFVLDDGTDVQQTITNALAGVTENRGYAPGANFPPPFDPTSPDGEVFIGTNLTDGLREFAIDQLPLGAGGGAGQATLQAGTGATGRIAFSNDDETASNQAFNYTNDVNGNRTVDFDGTEEFAVVLNGADLSNAAIVIEEVIFDPGTSAVGLPATVRVEIRFTDGDGDSTVGAVYFTDDPAAGGGFLDGQDLVFPLELFTGPAPAAGTVLAPGVVNVNDLAGNPLVDFDRLVSVELRVLDDPTTLDADALDPGTFPTIGSFQNPALIAGEIVSTGATDLSIDGILFRDQAPPEGGVLAETDVFAQVDENGAFSFAEALAAFQSFDL